MQEKMDQRTLKIHLQQLVQLEMAKQGSQAQQLLLQQAHQQQKLWEDQNLAIRVNSNIFKFYSVSMRLVRVNEAS